MSKFGDLKVKLLNKLTETFNSDNKSDVKNILKQVKSNKDLTEMYLFYEDVENKYISNKETATLFVEEVETLLKSKTKNIQESCNTLNQMLSDVVAESNEVYNCLDILSEESNLMNIEQKVSAKQSLIKHLTTEKTGEISESEIKVQNQSLLNTVLVSNFNTKFSDFLSEGQKEELKKIVSMKPSELENEMATLKESLNNKIDSLINESSDSELTTKLQEVRTDVKQSKTSKYNYYRLAELSKNLN
jgi:hypothetical protein